MNTYVHCTIRCIRSVKDTNNDDLITIKPYIVCDSNTGAQLQYAVNHEAGHESSPNGTVHKSLSSMSASTLYGYIDTLFDLLYYDEDPFDTIQVDIPGFPSILIRTSNLDLVRERVLCYLKDITASPNSWPLNTSTKVSVRSISVSESDLESEVESEVKVETKSKHKHESKSKKKNKHKKGCCTERFCPPRQEGARQHLFFDEDDSIREFHYDF
jgi:hypothetical protein